MALLHARVEGQLEPLIPWGASAYHGLLHHVERPSRDGGASLPFLGKWPRHTLSMARAGDGYDHMVKLLLIGEAGVGKSSILLRFTEDTFDEAQQAT